MQSTLKDGFQEINQLVTEDKAISNVNHLDISEMALKRPWHQ